MVLICHHLTFYLVCFLVFKSPVYLIFYILLYSFSRVFNNQLKHIFKQDRPLHPVKYLAKDTMKYKKK